MSLFEIISLIPKNKILISELENDFTAGQIINQCQELRTKLTRRNLGIITDNPIKGILQLIAADGKAESVTLLPTNIPEIQLDKLISLSGIDLIIGNSSKISNSNQYEIFNDFEKVPFDYSDNNINLSTSWNIATSGTTNIPKDAPNFAQSSLKVFPKSVQSSLQVSPKSVHTV